MGQFSLHLLSGGIQQVHGDEESSTSLQPNSILASPCGQGNAFAKPVVFVCLFVYLLCCFLGSLWVINNEKQKQASLNYLFGWGQALLLFPGAAALKDGLCWEGTGRARGEGNFCFILEFEGFVSL